MPDQVTIPFYGPETDPGGTHPAGPAFPGPVPWLPDPTGPDTNYAPQQPGDYPDLPSAPPPSSPPPSAPPSVDQPGVAPSFYDTASGWLGIGGSIFGSYRRRFVKSRLTKAIERAVSTGLERVFQKPIGAPPVSYGEEQRIGTELQRYMRGSGGKLPPGFPPAGAAPAGAAGLFAGLGTALTGLAAMFYPRGLFAGTGGDATYQELLPLGIANEWGASMATAERERRLRESALFRPPGQLPLETGLFPPRQPEPARRGRIPRFFNRLSEFEKNFAEHFPGEIAPILVNRGARVVWPGEGGFDQPAALPEDQQARPFPDYYYAGQPGEAPTSSPNSTTVPAPRSGPRAGKGGRLPPGQIRWGRIGIGVGALIAANTLLPRLFGGNPYSGSVPTGAADLNATIAPGPATSVSPQIGSFAIGGYGGGGAYCEPRPRRPRRKCLERAPVAWRAGRNKGKAAGSKCLRYAQRKS